ncbi:epoxide hydrolase [Aspergillus ruber CBS 135680]|uniref:Alpha/beta-hydrolase n=1 Tax=Aspergillus ruber (strain CBS 135680) TaxID=1388766 RepID=A0A017S433_ASPRC|nr:alpha/beta-hydrolase [Aspergillus ruber CBS 135680]EYE91566.1 alpha/beta-hydrolase [Aspergillus ruber CBS 135680]
MGLKSPVSIKDLKFNIPVPYKIHVDRELLEQTKRKLSLARYPEEQSDFGEDNWTQGAKVSRVKQLTEFWRDQYNWEEEERQLNAAFNHFLVKIDVPGYGSLVLHYTHSQSSRSNAIPLLFSHGWPSSFVEAVRVVHPLTEPDNAADPAFNVVAPSIPGFGFSPAPTKSGVGPNIVARSYKILMTDVLGYPKFVTQGGDFGSFITRSIAIQYPQVVRAQHLNMFPAPPPTLWSAPLAYLRWCFSVLTYSDFEHRALQTLGFALGDSPVGLLAWFVEKFHDWAEVYEALNDSNLITLVMMHWIQGATPALRFYWEAFGHGMNEAGKTFETYVSIPTGVSMYAKEQLHCPRDWATQAANIQYWREYEKGGHFSSLERPDLFIKDLREFISSSIVLKSYIRE